MSLIRYAVYILLLLSSFLLHVLCSQQPVYVFIFFLSQQIEKFSVYDRTPSSNGRAKDLDKIQYVGMHNMDTQRANISIKLFINRVFDLAQSVCVLCVHAAENGCP